MSLMSSMGLMGFGRYSLLLDRSVQDSEIVLSNTGNMFLNDSMKLNNQVICSLKTLNNLCGHTALREGK